MPDDPDLSPAAMKVLRRAAKRPSRAVCPTLGFYGRAQELLILALRNRGLVTETDPPALTDAGMALVKNDPFLWKPRHNA